MNLLSAFVDQLSLPAGRGRRVGDLQIVTRDRKWPRLLGSRVVWVAARLKAHGKGLTGFVDGVGAEGADASMHRGLVLVRRALQTVLRGKFRNIGSLSGSAMLTNHSLPPVFV